MKYFLKVNGRPYEVEIERAPEGYAPSPAPSPASYAPSPAPTAAKGIEVKSPLAGSIFNILVNVGQHVSSGDTLLVLEAMKMENEIAAPASGTVKQILVSKGMAVEADDILVVLN